MRVFLWTGERELVRSILGLWRDLREVRRKQGFTITSHKLTIHKEAPDQHQDLKVVFSNILHAVQKQILDKRMDQGGMNEVAKFEFEVNLIFPFAVSSTVSPKLSLIFPCTVSSIS